MQTETGCRVKPPEISSAQLGAKFSDTNLRTGDNSNGCARRTMKPCASSSGGNFKRFTRRSGIASLHPDAFFRALNQLFEPAQSCFFFLCAHSAEHHESFISR